MAVYGEYLRIGVGPTAPRDLFLADVAETHVEHPEALSDLTQAVEFEAEAQEAAFTHLAERLIDWSTRIMPEGALWLPDTLKIGPVNDEAVLSVRGIHFLAAQHKSVTLSKKHAGPRGPLKRHAVAMFINTSESPKTTLRQPEEASTQRIMLLSGKARRTS